jgi:hypothetical protein
MGTGRHCAVPWASLAEHMKIKWWHWLPFQPWRVVGIVESADEVPKFLPRNGAAIVGAIDRPKWVAFDCPCRSGHRILLNTDQSRQPAWHIQPGLDVKLSLAPSVDYATHGRRCHYFVRDGRVLWAKDAVR